MEATVTTTTPADLWLQATGEEPAKELSQIPPQMAADLVQRFVPFAQQVAELAALAAEVEVTEEDDTAGMAEARRLRLAMRAVRVEANKVRKEEKQYAFVVGKIVDFLGRSIRERAELVEERLEESEKFAERREEERKVARRLEFDLAEMTDAAFDKLLAAMLANHEAASTDDVDKVRTLYRQIRAIEVPEMQNVYGAIGRMVREELDRLMTQIEEQMRRAG